jgi:hypothetical protein
VVRKPHLKLSNSGKIREIGKLDTYSISMEALYRAKNVEFVYPEGSRALGNGRGNTKLIKLFSVQEHPSRSYDLFTPRTWAYNPNDRKIT